MHRLATQQDLESVYAIYMHDSVIPFLGYDAMDLEEFRPVYDELLKEDCFFVYEVAGEIAGFYRISRRPGRAQHVAYLGALAVSPRFQGRGIGQSIMMDVVQKLRTDGVKRVGLIVESDNAVGVSFYKKLGFQIEGTLKKFYKRAHEQHYIDDYIMALLIDERVEPGNEQNESISS